jgi:RNA polymerase sigma-70 factor, ECF subfamily
LIFRAVEDTDLIARVRKGDVEAFNVLISHWEKRVFNYLLRLVGNQDQALDLSQDVFLKAWQNIRKLDDPARFGPWLYRIAHNEAYSSFRKRRPETATAEGTEQEQDPLERIAAPGFPIEMTLAVTAALDRLNTDQREAVVLKVYEGLKFEEMAEVLDCPVSTVKSRVYTALELLKTELSAGRKPVAARTTATAGTEVKK